MDALSQCADTLEHVLQGDIAIEAVAGVVASIRGLIALTEAVTTPAPITGPLLVDLNHNTVSRGGKSTQLTPTEAEILQAIVAGDGAVVEKVAIMTAVYGRCPKRSIVTMRRYITDLRAKLLPLNCAIETAYGEGYRLAMDGPR